MDRNPSLDPNGQAPHLLPPTHMARPPSHSPSSPLVSSAPATPTVPTPRRPSHPATSPLPPAPDPHSPRIIRRASSSVSLSARSTPPPKQAHPSSRHSLGAEDAANGSAKRPTPKRSISNLVANLREASQGPMARIEEPVPLTAEGIAAEHFARELEAHANEAVESETVVLLHDACYGHKWSRPKTTKTSLSMIVERPERISACVLGASVAYVRMGGQHAGGRAAPRPGWREGSARPPFKLRRTGRSMAVTSPYVTAVHGTAWMSELRGMCDSAATRLAAGEKEIQRSDPEARTLHPGDLYLCPDSLDAFQGALGGVAEAVDCIFHPAAATRRAFVAVRPPGHHCSSDHPSGFCWLNNVHVGIEYAAQVHGLTHAVILDFDLHHGDGSQAIAWQRNSKNNEKRLSGKPNAKMKLGPDIGYYSLHDINSYPCELGDDEKVQAASLCIEGAHGQNIWNVHLQTWKTEDEFWTLYETRYRILLHKARAFLREHAQRHGEKAKAAVFISAGFDASEWEGSGMQRHKVNVPTEFYARFTRECVQMAQEARSGCEGRVISVLEGGYSDRALCSGVLAHLSGLCGREVDAANSEVEVKKEKEPSPGLDEMMRGLQLHPASPAWTTTYDKSWWAPNNLTALEHHISPPPPLPAGTSKRRNGAQPTYATPTESFAYKVVDPNKFARSISGTMRETPIPARPPTPPAPEVSWIVASVELSKLLKPIERGEAWVRSKTAEELGGVRTKKERQSAMPALSSTGGEEVGKPRQLRERKGKMVVGAGYAASSHSDEVDGGGGGGVGGVESRSVSRASDAGRRQTIAEFPLVPDAVVEENKPMPRRQSRRLSAGSALSLDAPLEDSAPPPVPVPAARGMPSTNSSGARAMAPPPAPAPRAIAATKDSLGVKKARAPSSQARNAAPSAPSNPLSAPAQTAVNPSAAGLPAASTDVDRLTTGMKRISLKLGTREESERKVKEKEAAQRRERALKGAETRRVNAAARKASAASNGGAAARSGGAVPTSVAPSMPALVPSADPVGVEGASAQSTGLNGSAVAPAPLSREERRMDEPSASGAPPAASATSGQDVAVPVASATNVQQQMPVDSGPMPTYDTPEAMSYPAATQENMNVAASFEEAMLAETAASAPVPEPQRAPIPFQHPPFAYDTAMPMHSDPVQSPATENELVGTLSAPSPANPNGAKTALPIWSSTGPIPFAPAKTAPVPSEMAQPYYEQSNGEGTTPADVTFAAHAGEPVDSRERAGGGDGSVWEVPETPKK